MKNQSLLRRFRWPVIVAFVAGIVLMLIAAVIELNDDTIAVVGVALFFGAFAVAAALEMIDETPKTFE